MGLLGSRDKQETHLFCELSKPALGPAAYSVVTGGCFLGGKAAWALNWPLTPPAVQDDMPSLHLILPWPAHGQVYFDLYSN